PRHRDIYPEDEQLQIMKAGAAAQNFEGAVRPGHFDGMLTVVHRLFNQVQPSHAFFGEKDAQQLCLVKQLVVDFDLPLEVVGCPLVRDKDGLALSSRNQRLSIGGRQRALAISRALNQCQADFAAGERRASTLIKGMTGLMQASQLDLQYCAIVDDCSFSEIDGDITSSSRAIIAAEVDSVHLIDNQSLDPNAC
ncbi:MAG: pantoate--beta-alanine ligase, partial [Planctomycetota bacterium]|nr:pantoate--beta-alanine ligase [Planctomycetota bacterium]